MAKSIYVNGPCLLSFGAQGAAGGGALTELGLTKGSVRLDLELYEDEVHGDAGAAVEIDVQDLGKAATITAKLNVWDRAALETLIARTAADAPTEPSPGTLMLANSKMFRLVITSPLANLPYRFLYVRLMSPVALDLGTIRTEPDVRFRAIPGTGVQNSMVGLQLYDRTAT